MLYVVPTYNIWKLNYLKNVSYYDGLGGYNREVSQGHLMSMTEYYSQPICRDDHHIR